MSMKNKFVTAVTTAGLLAGILGSAFAPSARAAADDAALTMAYGAADATDTTYAYFSTAAYPVFTVTIDPDNTDDTGVYGVNVSGGTIRACTLVGADTDAVPGAIVAASTSCSANIAFASGDDNATWTVTLNKLAAGAVVTVTASDDDTTAIVMTDVRKIKGQASTALAAKLDVTKTLATLKWDANSDNTADTTDLSDVSIGGIPYFATSGDFGSVAEFRGELRNGYNTAMPTDTVVVAEVTGSNYINCDETVGGSITAGTDALATFTIATGSDYECAVTAADGAEGTGGAWTATLKTAAGQVIATVKGGFLGEIASATVTAAASRIASNLGADITDFFTVVLKDAAGRSYGAADAIDAQSGIDMLVWDVADATEADIAGTAAADGDFDGKLDLDKEICADDADAPTAGGVEESRKVQLAFTDGAGDDVLSNTLTLVCGVAVGTDLEVRSIAMAAASVVPGGTVDAWIYLQDADGNLAGYGDKLGADLELVLAGGTNADIDADGDLENADYTTKAGGYIVVTLKAPATAGSVVTLSDPASAAIAKSIVQSDSFDNTIVASGRKVTANFGPAAAKKKVTFVVEFASGTVRSYVRKANASGVAVFTSPFGKVYVTASYGDEISDTVYLRK